MVRYLAGITAALCTLPAVAQVVVGNDQSSPTMWLVDVTGVNSPRALLAGSAASVMAITADEPGQTLYWSNGTTLYKAAYQTSGALVPVIVGTISGIPSITGLAYDTAAGVLYARGSGGFYSINTTTAVATLVFASTAQDFGGLEYDAANDVFYATNDSTSTILVPGRGLYRITKPINAQSFTRLASYPSGDTDIDGLSVGGGILYLVNDTGAQPIYRYDIASGQYLSSITSPLTGTVPTPVSSGGAWAPGLMDTASTADVQVTLADTPDPIVPPGGALQYTITVTNNGPSAASAVAVDLSLPGGITFLNASSPLSHAGGQVTGNLGTLLSGEQRVLTVNIQTGGPTNLVAIVDVDSPTADPISGNNQAQATTTVRNVQADLGVTITDPSDCTLTVGQTYSYVVTLTNHGPEAAAGVQAFIVLPTNATFLGSVPPITPSNNTLTMSVGNLAVNDSAQVEVFIQTTQAGLVALSVDTDLTTEDPNSSNDFAYAPTRIATPPPTSASALGMVSTLASHPTSLAPGMSGARYTDLAAAFHSPNGSRWVLLADTDAPSTTDGVVLLGDALGHSIIVRENMFPLLPTNPPNSFSPFTIDPVLAVTDSGLWAISGIDNRPTVTDDGYVVSSDGSSATLIAQESLPLAALGADVNFGSQRGGVRLADSGSALFAASLAGAGVAPGTDQGLLALSASWGVARKGVTVPSGQRNGNAFAYTALELGANAALAPGSDSTGTRFIEVATIADTANFDRVVVVDNAVVAQEGVVLPSFSSPVALSSPFHAVRMEPTGDWTVIGSNADAQDWVLRNGSIIARTTDEIIPGSGEDWSQLGNPATFTIATQTPGGLIILGGSTDNPDPLRDSVIVRDAAEVLLRENDPVDLNADGLFNEDLFIRSFVPGGVFASEDGTLFALVHLRSGDAARCVGDDLDLGRALIRVPGPAAPCDGDVNCDFALDGFDVEVQEKAVGGDVADYCQPDPDFNGDFALDGFDVEAVELVVGGGPCP